MQVADFKVAEFMQYLAFRSTSFEADADSFGTWFNATNFVDLGLGSTYALSPRMGDCNPPNCRIIVELYLRLKTL
jgi:hypothetical protein